jgi:putative membrane protein
VASFYTALVVALALAVVNLILKPILIILTLPINILTLGLFTLVINGLLLWLVSTFVRGFEVAGFTPAFLAALIISVVSFVGHKLLSSAEKHD